MMMKKYRFCTNFHPTDTNPPTNMITDVVNNKVLAIVLKGGMYKDYYREYKIGYISILVDIVVWSMRNRWKRVALEKSLEKCHTRRNN